MPLEPGKKGIGPNIKTEEAAGKSPVESLAIALNKARETGAKIPPPKNKKK